jgi:hypothetical protein
MTAAFLTAVAGLLSSIPPFPRVTHSPAHPSVRDCKEHWFEQVVDHFNAAHVPGGRQTWKQRYFVCRADLLAAKNAPILFYCGNEANVEL